MYCQSGASIASRYLYFYLHAPGKRSFRLSRYYRYVFPCLGITNFWVISLVVIVVEVVKVGVKYIAAIASVKSVHYFYLSNLSFGLYLLPDTQTHNKIMST